MRAILVLAIPLVLTQAVHSVNIFLDRTFLAWYSKDCFGAALQAGMLHWTILNVFFHTVGYASTFVAQYIGAKQDRQVGPILWQAVYMALIGGALLALLAPLGYPLFRWIGHEGALPRLEADYFAVLCAGSGAFLLNNALGCYYSGQGKTGMLLFVNTCSCLLNACLNVWLIFKQTWIFPEGMMGAAWATVISAMAGSLVFALLIFVDREADIRFKVRTSWRFSVEHIRKLLKYGLPAGVHGLIDMIGFTTFMMVVGLFGYKAQFASNMAMNINLLLFIPAVGIHIAAQILSGQFCGAKKHDAVERMTSGAFVLGFGYMLMVVLLYTAVPEMLVQTFRGGMSDAEWIPLLKLARVLLLIVAFYSLFDAFALIFSGTLKGAGDTQFVMWVSVIFSQVLLTGPCLILAAYRHKLEPMTGLYIAWGFCSAYVLFLGTMNFARYWFGHWKTIDMVGPGHGDAPAFMPPPLDQEPIPPA
jgi:MATE family multidrug resistance protein